MPHDQLGLLVDEDGKAREECGVFGVFGSKDAASLAAYGLHALQHRGQESCGIACYDSDEEFPHEHLGKGLVSQVFSNPRKLGQMSGHIAVGHVRYATRGERNDNKATQPFTAKIQSGSFSLAHNGQINNAAIIRESALKDNYPFRSNSDSESIVSAICVSKKASFLERIQDAVSRLNGAFALVIATSTQLIGVRDPNGIRPLVLGQLRGNKKGYVLASESCALDIVEADLIRDIAPGETIIIDESGYTSHYTNGNDVQPQTCIFEYVYFSRPDSILDGRHIYASRYNMGLQMALQEKAQQPDGLLGDVVISVPDSGNPAAMGFAKGLGLDYQMGIIRNHYVGRSFIEPTQALRNEKVRMKHSANKSIVAGKRIYVVDDSLVRGTTSQNIVDMLYNAGATEVHFRISCPQVRHSCIYGIDIPNPTGLLSNIHNGDLDRISKQLKMDSVRFLELKRLYNALGIDERNPDRPQFTDHYFTGDYPIVPETVPTNPQMSLPLD